MANEPLIEISNLSKSFNIKQGLALEKINASILPGKIIGLVGPDGAGKTTLIRIMAGLLKPTEGTIKISGFDTIENASRIYEIISYMPQKFGLYEDLTVNQNLNLYADLQGLSASQKNERFATLLKFTNLKNFTNRLAGKLSGGMKQKLALACTLVSKPRLLILDEPSVGVDPISRRELWKMIEELVKENITVIWSTSYLDEAEKCSEVLLLSLGKLLFFGPPEKLTSTVRGRCFHIENAIDKRKVLSNALNDENIIDAVIQGSSVRLVAKQNTKPDISSYQAGENAVLKEVVPRFEDAFMDVLGGAQKGLSPMVEFINIDNKNDKPIVEVKNLVKRFGSFTAANKITFSVKPGEIFGLLGPNGAGKSTTFKMLCGLLKPTEGEAFIDELSIQKVTSQARSKIGYMAQKFSLYNNMTVLQNLNFFSSIYPAKDKREEIVKKMLDIFDLKNFSNIPTHDLPLGFKQRLALSCAIMHSPKVLFLDEPTSGVDPITRREFWKHINAMVQKGMSIIITTHFMDEAEYCDRIGLINNGNLIKIGSPDELKDLVKSKDLPSPTLEDAFIELSNSNGEKPNG
ncbi:MAG: ATP-binding cassette domain-containing protein [Parachlamydiales bacterium]|jgi:ABC-2 type transport system ATP-binding protein